MPCRPEVVMIRWVLSFAELQRCGMNSRFSFDQTLSYTLSYARRASNEGESLLWVARATSVSHGEKFRHVASTTVSCSVGTGQDWWIRQFLLGVVNNNEKHSYSIRILSIRDGNTINRIQIVYFFSYTSLVLSYVRPYHHGYLFEKRI